MKLWELRPVAGVWSPSADTVIGFIVRAESVIVARMLAREKAAGEGSYVWLDATLTSCTELSPEGDACVVMAEFSPD